MQNKGIIKFAAIVLTLLSLYALSFTFVTNKVENDAKEYAKGDLSKERRYLDSISNQPVYPLLNHTYQYVKQREIQLGLDLKGGMNVTMEIELTALIKSLANNPSDATFNQALKNAQNNLTSSKKNLVALFVEEYEKLSPTGKLAIFYSTKENASEIKLDASNSEVKSFLDKQANSAVERSFNILRTRIDKFGVTQPNIQLQEGSNRILVELPGVTDKERVRKLLQGSAQLEFYETYDNQEIFPILQNVNNILAAKQPKTETKAVATQDSTPISKDKPALLSAKKDTTKKDSSSIDALAKTNPLFAILSPATFQGANGQQSLRPGPTVGYANQSDTAKINAIFAQEDVKALIPANVKLYWGVKAISTENKVFELYAVKPTGVNGEPALAGDVISNAREDFDQRGNPEVVMVMKSDGAREWKRITALAAGSPQSEDDNKSIAIVLDNSVYTAPRVSGEIPNGISSISGNFTVDETKDLANVLKAGKLPAPAKIVGEYVVGPTLGKESIDKGLVSSIAGLVVVLLFMLFYYSKAGYIANLALLANLFFLLGIMASIGAVWTLPGIAGLVLTIGMAVDANVLIYERIKEELELGKSLKLAVADGFSNAYSAIIDSNVTTLITGVILMVMGSGPILGFATTLVIGIIVSMFTAIFISRLILERSIKNNKTISFSTSFTAKLFKGSNFDFVKGRRKFYILSSVIIIAGIISIFTRGFSLGVDFQGGRTYVVDFQTEVSTVDVRKALTNAFENDAPEVKSYGNGVRITTDYLINDNSDNVETIVEGKLNEGLQKLGVKYEIKDAQKVGPTVANDIKTSAIYAVILAILAVFIYIVVRFRKWEFGAAAVVALLHDVLVLLAIFSLLNGFVPFSLDIDQAFIAAVLTVMGYSINDTVVVFDRVREYLNDDRNKKETLPTIVNNALNSTLSRTVVTGMSTIFVLIILFIFGGEILRGFSFAMLIGVIFGTYSSLFVATPFVVEFIRKNDKDKDQK
ncbi:protein translocase subunit SecDF [Pedobacter cryophilus]|uniref:Multifunctional fusion protein n=1 Tax=Pedobacter cryophilus TaxID=2571271 RepID=A0A4U1BWH4_9SPHI|nr:protein translocase subunit SecDF [Pedobacter cryophilus]TKB95577.1 protein translocase subunit SecDF [Pedobacter cryophilus]